MNINKNIKKTLILGSGPIVIGQSAEFDYSGTQACKALMDDGIETVLINSNPATIMTDPNIATKVYIEPLTADYIEKIITKEKPDSILPGMGGQTALNLVLELHDKGILDKYGIKVIGTSIDGIKQGEDRELFRQMMERISEPIINSTTITSVEEGISFTNETGFPIIIRPAYTLGGSGGGIADNETDFRRIVESGLSLSPVNQVLIEKSIKGWKEIEYEVMRDSDGNAIIVCNMENIDPVGIHTGDSIVVAPSQTLSDKEYQMLRTAALNIVNSIGIIGGCNVQFALNPDTSEYAVIEVNPRVSRSSALASKATGYPIAKVSAKLALGYRLYEIINEVTSSTMASFEPALDYVVVKIPKWPFDKFTNAEKELGTKMMATGEIMAIGANFEAALLKGIRSLDNNTYSLSYNTSASKTLEELKSSVMYPDSYRLFDLAELLRRKYQVTKLQQLTGIDSFFINKVKWIVEQEEKLKTLSISTLEKEYLLYIKKKGFSDRAIAQLMNEKNENIYNLRINYGIRPSYKMVDTCAGEFEASTSYCYSTYEEYDEVPVTNRKKIIVIGSGPIKIGQGIEFDYSSVHAVQSLKKYGFETIIINSNPETVSTDYDTSDKLYFEPVTEEDVYSIIEKEKPVGVVLQFGGQTAIKLAPYLTKMGIKILGTDFNGIDMAEDRKKFDAVLEKLYIKRPVGNTALSLAEGIKKAADIGYPVLVRPSYVLGGQGMKITHNQYELKKYLTDSFLKSPEKPVLIDKYIPGTEVEVDAVCDGNSILIPGFMEHVERAGVHSGDSISLYPAQNISNTAKQTIYRYTQDLARELKIIGMLNIQFIIMKDDVYVIEANPRASRTVPYISKVSGIPIIDIATGVLLGHSLGELGYDEGFCPESSLISAKIPVFSTEKLPAVEVSLGPEMKSTGEILGVGKNLNEALIKGFAAAKIPLLQPEDNIVVSIAEDDKNEFLSIAKELNLSGINIYATKGTADYLLRHEINAYSLCDENYDQVNLLTSIKRINPKVLLNTPTTGYNKEKTGFKVRRHAVETGIPIMTSLDTFSLLLKLLKENTEETHPEVYSI